MSVEGLPYCLIFRRSLGQGLPISISEEVRYTKKLDKDWVETIDFDSLQTLIFIH